VVNDRESTRPTLARTASAACDPASRDESLARLHAHLVRVWSSGTLPIKVVVGPHRGWDRERESR